MASRIKFTGGTNSTELAGKARAISVSWSIVAFVVPFYLIQLLFGIVQIAGFGAEFLGEQFLWGAGAYILPGQDIWFAGWLLTMVTGVSCLFAALFLYTFTWVPWWRLSPLLIFFACLALSITPIVNIFPWLLAWMFSVIRAQK